jgi:hypothetical protein
MGWYLYFKMIFVTHQVIKGFGDFSHLVDY